MADTFTAVFDSCVLFPFGLRDLLVQLATTGLFRGRWSRHIHEEWIAAVLREFPHIKPETLYKAQTRMDEHVLDCVVEGYEDLIDSLKLPDPKDRHVLAAAIRCGAQVIVTKNLKDFPANAIGKYGIEAQHPDEFVACLLSLSPGPVCASIKVCRARLRNPPYEVEAFLDSLIRQELVETVAGLQPYADLL